MEHLRRAGALLGASERDGGLLVEQRFEPRFEPHYPVTEAIPPLRWPRNRD